jgi:hypothetical protein
MEAEIRAALDRHWGASDAKDLDEGEAPDLPRPKRRSGHTVRPLSFARAKRRAH